MTLVTPAESPAPDEHNEWRLDTPGSQGWERSPRPDAADKYFMVSTDGHVQEPADLWATRMDKKYEDRLPGIIQDAMQKGLDEENAERAQGDALEVDVDKIGDRPSGEIADENTFVQRAIAATSLTGGTPRLGRGSTDSNIPISQGVPSITIGGGGAGGAAHSLDEYYINRDGPAGIQRALLVLLAQAGLSPVME